MLFGSLISSVVVSIIIAILLREFIAPIMLFSLMAYGMSLVELVTLSRYKEHALMSVGARVSQVCLSLAFFFWFGLDGFLLGYALSYLIAGYRFFLGLRHFTLNLGELRGIWRFIAQVYGANASYALLSYLDKIIVGLYFGYFVLGSYQLAFQVYAFLAIFPITIFNYILPHQARGSLKRRVKIMGFAFICVIVILVVLVTPTMFPYLFPKYNHVVSAIQIIVFAIIPLTLVIFLRSNILAKVKRARSMLYAGLISLTIEITSIIILGSLFGINGISSAMVLTMTVEFIFLLVANKGHIFHLIKHGASKSRIAQ